jgi:hypothetical protein
MDGVRISHYHFSMENKQKALVTGLIAVAVIAVAMFLFYEVQKRSHNSEDDVEAGMKAAAVAQQTVPVSELTGTYGANEPIEGNGKRFASFTISQRADGALAGAAKLDTIGGDSEGVNFLNCMDVKTGEKDLFIKCNDPALGVFSFSGEWHKAADGVHATGHILWAKDGNAYMDKGVTVTRLSAD